MRLDDVHDHIRVLMRGKKILNAMIRYFKDVDASLLFQDSDFRGLVFRTFLVRSNEFKANLPTDPSYADIRTLYRSIHMPKFVWLTEISSPKLLNDADPGKRKRIGEVILDSTADRHSYFSSYLAIHFKGRLIMKKPGAEAPFRFYHNAKDEPCPHLVREG